MKPMGTGQSKQMHVGWAFLVLTLLALLTGISRGAAAINAARFREILIGTVSDSVCGGTHIVNGHGDADCTRLCVTLGAKYALVDGTRVLILNGHQAELKDFAGKVVVVTGIVSRNTVTVESVALIYTSDGPVYAGHAPNFPGNFTAALPRLTRT